MCYWVINRVATRPLFGRRRRGKRVGMRPTISEEIYEDRSTNIKCSLSLSLSVCLGPAVNIYYFENSPVDSINHKSVYTSPARLYINGPSIFLNYPRVIRSRRDLDHRPSVCDPCGGFLYGWIYSVRRSPSDMSGQERCEQVTESKALLTLKTSAEKESRSV